MSESSVDRGTRNKEQRMQRLVMVQRTDSPGQEPGTEPMLVEVTTEGAARLVLDDGIELVVSATELLVALGSPQALAA